MPRKKISKKEEIDKVLKIVNGSYEGLSIREVKNELERKFNIRRSPQVVKRYLIYLKRKNKIR